MARTDPAASQSIIPGQGLDLQNPEVICDLFLRAADANLKARRRKGSVINLSRRGKLVISGDLHDHGPNFLSLVRLADLAARPDHHLILHEVIHGPNRISGRDFSIRTLARVAALKLQFPRQVHLIQSNHELAQLWGEGISKNGANSVEAFEEGVAYLFGEEAHQVVEAMGTFIRSLALAVRCANGLFISHSLPSPRQLESFDATVIDRIPTEADLSRGGSGYNMVWGRRHTQDLADTLGRTWGAEVFVMGHQPADVGYEPQGRTMLVIASDHERGMALPIRLSRQYSRDELIAQLVPLGNDG